MAEYLTIFHRSVNFCEPGTRYPAISKTGNGESGNGNGEWERGMGTGNGERGMGIY